jgi:uncharacterized protein
MRRIRGEATLARIFIGESDHYRGRPMFEAIVHLARKTGLAGATVLRGVEGFGASSVIHSSRLLRLSQDLPLIIEVVDEREQLRPFLDQVEAMLEEADSGGLITFEKVQTLRYESGGERDGS